MKMAAERCGTIGVQHRHDHESDEQHAEGGKLAPDQYPQKQTVALATETGLTERRVNLEHLRRIMSLRLEEIFQLIAAGRSIVETAREYRISRKTVETHVYRVYRKLGCHNVGDLVRFAAEHGLLRMAPFEPRKVRSKAVVAERPEPTMEMAEAP